MKLWNKLKIRIMYRLPKWNMITDKLTSFWDQLQVTIIVMSIAFSPQTHSVHFLSTSTVLYTHVYNEYHIQYAICPEVIHPLTPTHTPHTPTSHPVTFTHNSLTHSQTPPPPHLPINTHRITTTLPLALCTKWLPWKRFCFCFLLQKLTQSMHLDNKLDWVNQPSFQGIHFVFLLGLSLFILNIKYLKLS